MLGDEIELGRENFGVDGGNPREILPVLMRHVRKGTLGGIGGDVHAARLDAEAVSFA